MHALPLLVTLSGGTPDPLPHQTRALRVTVLSTMLADHAGVGARELGIDLSTGVQLQPRRGD